MPYIDRDAFIKQQRELYCKNCARRMGVKNGKLKEIYKIGEAACKSCELNDALDDLDDYPEADVAPVVHGHWIVTDNGANGKTADCSVCGSHFVYFKGHLQIDKMPGCPKCLSKMDEEAKE